MISNKYKNYLKDLGTIIKETSIEAREKSILQNNDYNNGRLMAYYEVISLLKQQAIEFGIDLEDLNLYDFDEEKKLLF